MEIVIKIPEEEYEDIINSEDCGLYVLTRAIAKGTPLPKGHGRLIDADDLLDANIDTFSQQTELKIKFAPTIIEGSESE